MSRWAWSAGLSRLKLKSLPGPRLPEAGTVCQEKAESYHAPAAWTDWQISFCLDKWAELHYTAASCEDFSLSVSFCCLLFVPPYLFSLLSFSPPLQIRWMWAGGWRISTETGNRGVFVHHVADEHLSCQNKKKTERRRRRKGVKETVVLMLLEQQPTRMTKLRLKPFSPQLASHECWKIEIVFLLSDVSNTSTNVSNGLCKPTV